MFKKVTIDQFLRELRNLETVIDRNGDKYARELLTSVRRFIISTGSIDSGQMLLTYDFFEYAKKGNASVYRIEPRQAYGRKEGFVEFSRDHYYYGTYLKRFEGRKFVEKGIKAANLRAVTNEIIFEAFN